MGFLRHALLLLNTFRFTAMLTYVQVEGTYGRTEVKAGRAITDSFETSNVVLRSDTQMRVYAAELLTETDAVGQDHAEEAALMSPRSVIGLSVADRSHRAQAITEDVIDRFGKAGVVLRGIDVGADAVQDIANTNLAFRQAKSLARPEGCGRRAGGASLGRGEAPGGSRWILLGQQVAGYAGRRHQGVPGLCGDSEGQGAQVPLLRLRVRSFGVMPKIAPTSLTGEGRRS
jgi:hypothetical protein